MDPVLYYITTLTLAFKKILPIVLFLVGGHLVFIKLPFYLFKMNLRRREIKSKEDMFKKIPSGNENASKEEPKDNIRKSQKRPSTAEKMFHLHPDELISAEELKRRYFELLKKNHPDKAASKGESLKKYAESKTKDINQAYEELKKRAS